MSKKKRRYQRRIQSQERHARVKSGLDNHHCCFIKKRWSTGAIKELRQFHYCIVPLPKATLHHFIHDNISYIPVPKESNARDALAQLRALELEGAISDRDPIEKRLKVLAALFDCCDQPTADAFRRQAAIVRKFYANPP
jgi:hypothetical protein